MKKLGNLTISDEVFANNDKLMPEQAEFITIEQTSGKIFNYE